MTAWAGVPPATAEIPCEGERHRLRWEAGDLVPLDHDDAEAEEALAALGGRPPACLVVRSLWRAHVTTVELVTLGRRPAEERLGFDDLAAALDRHQQPVHASYTATGALPAAHRAALAARQRRLEAARGQSADLRVLLALPPALIDRLVLQVLGHCVAEWPALAFRDRHGLRLGAALRARAEPSLARLGASLAAGPSVHVECAPCPPGHDWSVRARPTADGLRVDAWLPLAWLPSVWARGVSEVGGQVVIEATARSDGRLDATALGWIECDDGSWTARGERGILSAGEEGRWRWEPPQASATRP